VINILTPKPKKALGREGNNLKTRCPNPFNRNVTITIKKMGKMDTLMVMDTEYKIKLKYRINKSYENI
jgi:hypothetical protein